MLYGGAFDAATPLANALLANDDSLEITNSGFARNLVAGTSYSLITTGFSNIAFGAFAATIGGPGAILPAQPPTAVPAPETTALLLLGLGAAARARRRRSRVTSTGTTRASRTGPP